MLLMFRNLFLQSLQFLLLLLLDKVIFAGVFALCEGVPAQGTVLAKPFERKSTLGSSKRSPDIQAEIAEKAIFWKSMEYDD